MKKPVTQVLPLVLSSLAFAGVFSSWVLGCQSGSLDNPTKPWPDMVAHHGQNFTPVQFLQKNDAWLRGQETWFSDADTMKPSVSLNTWLRHEAMLICNIYDNLRKAGADVADPGTFCGTDGTDPTNPPPKPCEWGECEQ
jgi:hypothetical protein